MSMKSPGLLNLMKLKEKSKFKPLFVASLSSHDIYNLISPEKDFFTTPGNINSTIVFEIYKNVTISGIQIFSSVNFSPQSFDIEIENKTVASIRNDYVLKGIHKMMTINFDPIRSNKIKFIQKGKNWDGNSYCIYLERIELISTALEYSNSVFDMTLFFNLDLVDYKNT